MAVTNTYMLARPEKKNTYRRIVMRGEIVYVDLGQVIGSEQGGIRPAINIQNNRGNHFSNTIIVAPITKQDKKKLPTHVSLPVSEVEQSGNDVDVDSTILLEQIKTVDIDRVQSKVGKVSDKVLQDINRAIKVSLGL